MEALRRVPSPLAAAVVCALALAVRLAIAATTVGSNDAVFWRIFADKIATHGLLHTYATDTWFNHPPLMGWLAAAVFRLHARTGLRFEVLFKLPSLVASVATVWLVHRCSQPGLAVLLLIALNPVDVLVTSYHGNTDGLCAFLCVLAVMLAERQRPFAAGLALAAALNVKLIPVVLVVPLAAVVGRRGLGRYAGALALGLLPFLWPMLWVPDAFLRNAVFYSSFRANWGLGLFVIASEPRLPRLSAALWALTQAVGKPLILLASAAWGLAQARWRVLSPWELAGLVFATFLVAAPGFGVQYLVYPTALLVIADRGFGLTYAWLAGLFAFLVYLTYWTGTFPPYSNFAGPFDAFASLFGFLVWLLLLRHVARGVRRAVVARRPD